MKKREQLSGNHTRSTRDWVDAAILTAFLWLTVVILYLPVLLARHPGEGLTSAAIEGATVLLAMAFGLVLFGVDRAVEPRRLAIRAGALVAGVMGLSACQTVADYLFTQWVALVFKPHWSTALPTLWESYTPFFTYVCLFAFNLALFHLVFWRRRAGFHRLQLAEARLEAKQAELTALRFQLNPHFLFNSLNAVSSLIVTERFSKAEEMTDRLADFLRHALVSDSTALVPLETELGTIENYLEVERVRFGDRLVVEIEVDAVASATLVPSFILQPLVENAIKYGVAPSTKPARVVVAARREPDLLRLQVLNEVPVKPAEHLAGTGIGLANVRQRLRAEYGAAATLDAHASPDRFEVLLTIPAS